MVLLAPRPTPNYAGTLALLGELPKHLRSGRDRLRITLATQARQMGIATSTLSNFDTGKSAPSYFTITAALRWLHTH